MQVRFDDSLPILVKVLVEELGHDRLSAGVALRDVQGRLCFFSAHAIDSADIERITGRLRSALGPYARADRVLVSPDDFGSERILRETAVFIVQTRDGTIRLLDRRLVGADWLRQPAPVAPPPPRFVFASLKGGVGRSTALAVAAADLASQGRRVLVVDLDMEAPGLGAMLLDDGTTPDFGLVDALVENGLSKIEDSFLADLVGPSSLADRHGRIDVVPAFGRRSIANPADVLGKLSRAYAEDIREDGTPATLLDQVRELVDRLVAYGQYDAVLIDARAGLHETTASAVLGLGAEVFLFGLDEPQTFQGYDFLLAHLARLAPQGGDVLRDWMERVTFVQGKAPADLSERLRFGERCRALFERSGLLPHRQAQSVVTLPGGTFSKVPWEDDASVSEADISEIENDSAGRPIAILEDERYKNFAPIDRKDLLRSDLYRSSYGEFLQQIGQAFDSPSVG